MPGQPPSINHMYKDVTIRLASGKLVRRRAKVPDAERYQAECAMLARVAKPTDFTPEGFVIVVYEFFVARDIDCDNTMKALNDAIAQAIGVNDRAFLPVALSKVTKSKDPEVKVTVYDAGYWDIQVVEKVA